MLPACFLVLPNAKAASVNVGKTAITSKESLSN